MNNILLFIGSVLVVTLGLLFAVPHFIDWNGYRGVFEEEASRMLGREVRVGGDVNVRLLPVPYVSFERLRIADTTGETGEPLFRADSFTMWLSVPPLLRGVLEASKIEVLRPVLWLGVDREGNGNWRTLSIAPGTLPFVPTDVALHSVKIVDGMVGLSGAAVGEVTRLEDINGELTGDALEGPYKFVGETTWRGLNREVRVATAPPTADGVVQVKGSVRAQGTGNTYSFDTRVGQLMERPRIDGELTARLALDPTTPTKNFAEGLARLTGATVPQGRAEIDLRTKFSGNATRLELGEIALNFENVGQPQLLNGTAVIAWADKPEFNLVLSSHLLDIDRLIAAMPGAGPADVLRPLLASAMDAVPVVGEGEARISIEQATIGGDSVSNLSLVARRNDRKIDIQHLSAHLPGGAHLEMSGALAATDEVPRFNGTMLLRGSSLSRFTRWAGKNTVFAPGSTGGAFSLESRVVFSPQGVEMSDANAELNGVPLTGGIRIKLDGRKLYAFNLEGYRVNAAQLGMGDAGLDVLKSVIPGFSAATPSWFDPADTDLKAHLRIGELVVGERTLRDVDADIGVENGVLSLPKLKFATADGLDLSVDGTVKNLADTPKGEIRWVLDAPSAAAFDDVAAVSVFSTEQQTFLKNLASLAPMQLAGSIGFGRHGNASTDIRIDGDIGGGRAVATLNLDRKWQEWHLASTDFSATIESRDVRDWLALARAAPMTIAREGPGHAGKIRVKAVGIPDRGLRTLVGIDSAETVLTYNGHVGFPANDNLALNGRLAVAATDVRDVLRLLGWPAGGGLTGRGIDGTFEITSQTDRLDARTTRLTLNGTPAEATISIERAANADDASTVTADISAEHGSVAALLAPFTDAPAAAAPSPTPADASPAPASPPDAPIETSASNESPKPIWSDEGFAFASIKKFKGKVTARFKTFQLDEGLGLDNALLEASLSPNLIHVSRLEGDVAGGRFKGAVELEKKEGGVNLAGALRIDGAHAGVGEAAPDREQPKAGISLQFSSRAQSPLGLIAALSGQGEIELGAVSLPGMTPRSVNQTSEDVLSGKTPNTADSLSEALVAAIAGSEVPVGPRKIPLRIVDGAARIDAFTVNTDAGSTRIETTVDLQTMRLDSEWRVQPRGSGHSGLPVVQAIYVGPLRDLATLQPKILTGPLERELTVRKMERDVDKLEQLRKSDEERSRQHMLTQPPIEATRPTPAKASPPPAATPAPAPPAQTSASPPVTTPPEAPPAATPPAANAAPPPPAWTPTTAPPQADQVGTDTDATGASPLEVGGPPIPEQPAPAAAPPVPAPVPQQASAAPPRTIKPSTVRRSPRRDTGDEIRQRLGGN
jgi:uncharacterized protein involved in outer membrane biogenesis